MDAFDRFHALAATGGFINFNGILTEARLPANIIT